MAVTPEGKIKKLVNKVLDEFAETIPVTISGYDTGDELSIMDAFATKTLYRYWPVPAGYGASSLDCIVVYYGLAIAIETKAPGKRPTPRQKLTIAEIKSAGGIVLVIDSEEGCEQLRSALNLIRLSHANANNS